MLGHRCYQKSSEEKEKNILIRQINRMPNKRRLKSTDFVRHFSIYIYILPNAVLRIACSINESGLAYGQIAGFEDLPVNAGPRLRTAFLFGRFNTWKWEQTFLLIFIMKGDCHAYAKTPDDLQSITNHPGFQFETEFFQSHVCTLYIIHSSLRSFQSQTARQESSSLTLISWKVVTVSTPVMVICAWLTAFWP